MNISYINNIESHNITPIKLDEKEQYYLDLVNIQNAFTGFLDVMFSNRFFNEAAQLVINAIVLFEKGYFDCAFYSLRQSLELSTTVVYLVDDTEINRINKIRKWQKQDKFPMHGVMTKELEKLQKVYADMKDKMPSYFQEIDDTKKRLNKYVHKQGYDKFYVSKYYPQIMNKGQEKLLSDFNTYLVKCIGAIAVLRLAIDPLPVLLADESIYNRTGDLITESYSDYFMNKYIGEEHIEAFKETDKYKDCYESIIEQEEMLPSVAAVVKIQYVDRTKIDEILSQKHLLNFYDIVAVALILYSDKITDVYCTGGFIWYSTNTHSKRNKSDISSSDLDNIKNGIEKTNVPFDEAFLSHIEIRKEDFYTEHNEELSINELIMDLKRVSDLFCVV
ncbi:MAG: teicoplanin resistance protein VanZ [Nitrospirae bacterium]|nr:teicoplanin resistance protein VanZ [Nitrospirota bacterium]